jgi:hypothetical protein
MSSGIARGRLSEERKNWRKDHPYGFYARPESQGDGSSNIMKWNAGVPGKFTPNGRLVFIWSFPRLGPSHCLNDTAVTDRE